MAGAALAEGEAEAEAEAGIERERPGVMGVGLFRAGREFAAVLFNTSCIVRSLRARARGGK